MSQPDAFDFAAARAYCAAREGASEELPFGPDVLVFKVDGKMFALLSIREPHQLSLKCDPERAELLREQYESIIAGYHLNKRHWITIILDGGVPAEESRALIDHSYGLVARKKRRSP